MLIELSLLQQYSYLSHDKMTLIRKICANKDDCHCKDDAFRNALQNTWFRKPLNKTSNITITRLLFFIDHIEKNA